ncbi:MAG: GDSL-type esterase/lipase family protein [Gemmatimonadota bacterium]
MPSTGAGTRHADGRARGGGGWLKNVIVSAGALVVCLLGVEIALKVAGMFTPYPRLYPGDKPVGAYEHTDTLIGWKLPPGAEIRSRPEHGDFDVVYRADAHGFRARPVGAAAALTGGVQPAMASVGGVGGSAGDTLRIAFLGDSFTFGVGVAEDETFVHRVESRLAHSRSFNFGMSGFGVDQMWLTLRHYAADVRPHIVVTSFVLDDLDRTLAAYRLRDTLEYLRTRGEIGWVPKPAFDLDRDGRLVPLDRSDRPSRLVREIRERSRILEGLRRVENRVSLRLPAGHRWRLNRALFAAMRDESDRLGARLILVYIPAKGLEDRPVPVFASQFGHMEIPFLDLRERLPADPSGLYFERDAHLNAAGHRFAGDEIADALIDLGWAEPAIASGEGARDAGPAAAVADPALEDGS